MPTFLDLPASFLGLGAPLDLLGVALYYSSIQSGCGYCTLHCCYFALARGVPRSCIVGPKNVNDLPRKMRCVARMAIGLASVPAQVRCFLRGLHRPAAAVSRVAQHLECALGNAHIRPRECTLLARHKQKEFPIMQDVLARCC